MSHEGSCTDFGSGVAVVDKIRMMGYSVKDLPQPLEVGCSACGMTVIMDKHEGECSKCGMIFGVTPCHNTDAANVKEAGIGY